MKVNSADVAAFRRLAGEKIWPHYRQQYGDLWGKIASIK